jgi:hypothetical protein
MKWWWEGYRLSAKWVRGVYGAETFDRLKATHEVERMPELSWLRRTLCSANWALLRVMVEANVSTVDSP